MKVLTQAVWIMVIILHDHGSFYLIGICLVCCIIEYMHMCLMLDASLIDIISSEKRMLICCV